MTVRGFTLVKNKELRLSRVVLEIRFSRSGAYYSRFGKMLDVCSEFRPDWFFNVDQKSGLGGSFLCVSSGLNAVISDTRLLVELTQKPDASPYDETEVHSYADDCEFLSDLFVNNVQPVDRVRIGFRQFYEVDFENEDEANSWVVSLGIAKTDSRLESAFDGKLKELSFQVTVNSGSYITRINVETGKREAILERNDTLAAIRSHVLSRNQEKALVAAEKKSAWLRRKRSAFATVDVDSFVESPTDDVLIGEFVKTRYRSVFQSFLQACGVQK